MEFFHTFHNYSTAFCVKIPSTRHSTGLAQVLSVYLQINKDNEQPKQTRLNPTP